MHQWLLRMQTSATAARNRNAKNVILESDEPASESEVARSEEILQVQFPPSFRAALLDFSRHINFFWALGSEHAPGEVGRVRCGSCEWNLDLIAAWHAEVTWLQKNAFIESEPDHQIWQNKFPVQSIGNGDFIAINTSPGESQYVVYLSHELCFSHGYRLGPDFQDFMNRWTQLGCVSDDIWPIVINQREDLIQLNHPNAICWRNWFGLP